MMMQQVVLWFSLQPCITKIVWVHVWAVCGYIATSKAHTNRAVDRQITQWSISVMQEFRAIKSSTE